MPHTEVWNRDSSVLAREHPAEFDLVLVDAPCSGQSLLAKGEAHTGAFHPALVNKCANRQRRIIANAAKLVRPGGYLAYMTCTFSLRENEEVLNWFLKHNKEFIGVEVAQMHEFASPFTELPCYRLFPQQGLGLGGFSSLLRRVSI